MTYTVLITLIALNSILLCESEEATELFTPFVKLFMQIFQLPSKIQCPIVLILEQQILNA